MYRMPKKHRAAKKGLAFEVRLIRLVMLLDSRGGKLRLSPAKTLPSPNLETLQRLIRIETALESLLRPKAPSPRGSDQSKPVQAEKKKSNQMRKAAGARARRAPSQPKKK
jgi:hypothetical protein